jgi:hypothetical protein
VGGGIVGVGVGYAMLKWIQSLIPPSTLPPAVDIGMDTPVLLFTLAVAVVTGLLFGVAPAAQATNTSLVSAMKDGGHSTTAGSPGRRVRGVLVVAEIALAFMLLVGSGLLMQSFGRLLDVDPGFDATNVLTAGLPISQERHPDPVELNAYLAAISAAVQAVPGVREAAITSALPLQGWGYGVRYSIAGREVSGDQADRRPMFFKMVSPSYFEALDIKLLAGRVLSDDDRAGTPPVAIINETLANREFHDEDPVGRRLLVRELVPGRITGSSGKRAWIVRNSAAPSSPDVVSALKFMSWITMSTGSRSRIASPAAGESALSVRTSRSEHSTARAVATAWLSSITRAVGIASAEATRSGSRSQARSPRRAVRGRAPRAGRAATGGRRRPAGPVRAGAAPRTRP